MRINVVVLEARDLPITESFAKVQVGKYRARTNVVRGTPNPIWNEEFDFGVAEVKEEADNAVISVFLSGEDVSNKLLGKVQISLSSLAGQENKTLLPTWLDKLLHKKEGTSKSLSDKLSGENAERSFVSTSTVTSFEGGLELMKSIDSKNIEMPENLLCGILLDEKYQVSPCALNNLLFSPGSQFRKDWADAQHLTDVHEGPWTVVQEANPCLIRAVAYMTCKTKMVKSVRATENQVTTQSVELPLEKTDLKSALRYLLTVVGALLLSAFVVLHILHRKFQLFDFYLLFF